MGVLLHRREVFFTMNGKYLGIAMKRLDIRHDIYPCVSLQGVKIELSLNFGEKPFRFDIIKFSSSLKSVNRDKHVRPSIRTRRSHTRLLTVLMQKTVRPNLMKKVALDYLICRGFGKTYEAMKSEIECEQRILGTSKQMKRAVIDRENENAADRGTENTERSCSDSFKGPHTLHSVDMQLVMRNRKRFSITSSSITKTACQPASSSDFEKGMHEISAADLGSLRFRTAVRSMIMQV